MYFFIITVHILLGVQLCFRHFFSKIRGFIVKNWLYIYDSSPKILLFQWKEANRRRPRKDATDTALIIIAQKRVPQVGSTWLDVDQRRYATTQSEIVLSVLF